MLRIERIPDWRVPESAGVVRPTSNGGGNAERAEAALRADAEGRRKHPAGTLGGARAVLMGTDLGRL